MKKIFVLTAAFIALSTSMAYAGHHEGDHGDGKHKGKMFEKKDLDGDGFITKDEFIKAHEERFNEMDANGDGKISKDEAHAKAETMREKMKERRAERKEKRQDKKEDRAAE